MRLSLAAVASRAAIAIPIALAGLLLAPGGQGTVGAQSSLDWSAPYCGDQPRITSIFDHQHPNYARDGTLMLFNGDDISGCNGPGYDGHSGWDFGSSFGDQGCGAGSRPGMAGRLAFAAQSGRVHRSRWFHPSKHDRAQGSDSAFGLYIDVAHDGDMASLYGHLAALFVDEGEWVQKGQAIGAIGTTGNSTGPHLHFQAGRGNSAASSWNSFDPYGWDRLFVPGPPSPPAFADPHRGNGWSERVIVPGVYDAECPATCAIRVVDDSSPDVNFTCSSAPDCPNWFQESGGEGGSHHWTRPNGSSVDYVAEYRCSGCRRGVYQVDAFVPLGADIANTHIARYEIGGEVTVVDQHTQGGIWHPLGIFDFQGEPMVRLTDRTDRHDYTAPASQKIGADALRFRWICAFTPAGTPRIDPPSPGPPQGGEG